MDGKRFKRIISDCFLANGFGKSDAYYFKASSEVVCVVGAQRSSFENAYYLNVGYFIVALRKSITALRDVDGDIRTRFGFEEKGKIVDSLRLDNVESEDVVRSVLERNIKELIDKALTVNGLRELLKRDPSILYQTKVPAITFLGLTTTRSAELESGE